MRVRYEGGILVQEALKEVILDPARKTPGSIVSHGHMDHLTSGGVMTPQTLEVLRVRRGSGTGIELPYDKEIEMNGFRVTLRDAGHVFRSAMVRVDDLLYTGDFHPEGGAERSPRVRAPAGMAAAAARRQRVVAGVDRPSVRVCERLVRVLRLHPPIRPGGAVPAERSRGLRGRHRVHRRVRSPAGVHGVQQRERPREGGRTPTADQSRSAPDEVMRTQSRREGNTVLLKLSDGEDLVSSVEAAATEHDVVSGSVLWGIGMVQDFEIGFFGPKGYEKAAFRDRHELLALHGSIAMRADQ